MQDSGRGGRPKEPTLPKRVKVGAQMWDIKELSVSADPLLAEGNLGYTQDSRNIIVIDKDQSESKKKVTVWHELMHAARMTFDADDTKKLDYEGWEHHFIGVWENSLLMILRDNPKLTEWLLEDK